MSSRRSAIVWSAVILAGAVFVAVRSERSGSDLRGFHAVWSANWQQASAENRPDPEDPYAPSFYVIFAPLGALPLWGAALVMYFVNIACTWGIVKLTFRLLDLPPGRWPPLLVPAIGVAPFFMGTILLGQNTLILMFLVLAAYSAADRRLDTVAGSLLGLATAIKVYPLLFLVPFVLRMRLKVLAGFAAALFLIAGVGATLFFGGDSNLKWHESWYRFVSRTDQQQPEDPHYPRTMRCTARYNNQAIQAVLARLMLDVPAKWYGNRFQVNLFALDAGTWRAARTAASLLLFAAGSAALLALHWTVRHGPPANDGPDSSLSPTAQELGLVCSWFFLMSPMVWTHYFLWAFFPLACVVRAREQQPRLATLLLGLWLAAECLIASKFFRAVGVNLFAGGALFAWFAATAVVGAVAVWRRQQDSLTRNVPTSVTLQNGRTGSSL